MRVLELFSGTHSIGKVAHSLGYEVHSLDMELPNYDKLDKDKKYKSFKHHQIDIFNFNYKQYSNDFFDIVTCSPVCLWWSPLRNTWIGRHLKNKKTGKKYEEPFTKELLLKDIDKYGKPMVDKCFEIINYFKEGNKNLYWWIENPQKGKMKTYIKDKPFYDVDYCKYSTWGYQKRTRFWTNIKNFKPLICKKDCENIITINTQKGDIHSGYGIPIKGKTRTLHKKNISGSKKNKSIKNAVKKNEVIQKLHKNRMGTSKTIKDNGKIIRVNTKALREKYKDYPNLQIKIKHSKDVTKDFGGGSNRLQRYRIPPKLIEELFKCM